MNVCVIACAADYPWKNLKCEDFPQHLHLSKRDAEKAVSRGELRFRAKGIYQSEQHEKARWKVKKGSHPGFVGLQMV
jgi:hypothetical protein